MMGSGDTDSSDPESYCTNCGEKVIDTAKFCPNCGADIDVPDADSQNRGQEVNGSESTGRLDKFPGFDNSNSRRRNVVVGGVYALAGCIGLGAIAGDGSEDENSGASDTSQEQSSDDNTGSNQESDNEEQVNNDADARTHEIGESFIVGDGNRAIEYTVTNIVGAETLGNEVLTEEADGIFIIVEMEIINQTDESFSISTGNYAIVTENENTFDPADDATVAYETDERFDTESILFEQIDPNLPTDGAIIFDIPPDVNFSFTISPASVLSSGDPHFVVPN